MSEEGFTPPTQQLSHGQPSFEELDSSSEPVLLRTPAGKRPRPAQLYAPQAEDSDAEDLVPELSGFFDDFETPLQDRIRLCRSYASYLSGLLKKPKKTK